MTLFINNSAPYLRILVPATGEYVQFQAGSLELAEDDPDYDIVMAEAIRNPAIAVIVNSTTCEFCGEAFKGDKAANALEKHGKEVHFDIWMKAREVEAAKVTQAVIKERAGYACDVCAPIQTFGTEADLSAHVKLLHTAPPELDGEGNEIGQQEGPGGQAKPRAKKAASTSTKRTRRPGEVDRIPTAKPKSG